MPRWIPKSFLFALLLLVVAEGVTRVFFTQSMSGRFEYGFHPTAGFQEEKDGTVKLVRAGGRRFHPQSFQRERPADLVRIMVAGDSVPRGPGLEGSYAWQAAEVLRQRGVKAEGLNLAVAGYGAHRAQVVLRQALKYRPSLMVLHVNDSNEYEDEREFKRAESFKGWHPGNWLMKSLIIRRLHELKTEKVYWACLPPEVRAGQAVNDADAEVAASLNAEKRKAWAERVRQYTISSVALARAQGIPILLVTKANLIREPGQPARVGDDGLDALAESLAGPGVYHLSLKALLTGRDLDPLFSDSAHLRKEGHAIIATAIADLVQKKSLAPNP
jgi:lysophospholipase L1-like esterase